MLVTFIGLGILAAIFYYFVYEPSTHKEAVKTVTKPNPGPGSGFRALLTFLYFITFFYFALNYYYNQ